MRNTLKIFLVSLSVFSIESIGDIGGGNGQSRNVFVTMSKGPKPITDSINSQNFPNREAKISALRNGLMSHAALTQAPVLNFLNQQSALNPVTFESMWISNQIFLKGVNNPLISALTAAFPSEIKSIDDETISHLNPITYIEGTSKQSSRTPWGIEKVKAPQVWEGGNKGEGVIVGSIDTGVRGSHLALRGNYVGNSNNGWFDPSRRTRSPNDQNGHGTHVMGTICGTRNNIGVAPHAKWIACKGCAGNGCSGRDLLACGQFMTCPTDHRGQNAKCDKAPRLVSNSWGGGRSNGFDDMIRAWQTAEIIPIFAAGNSGPRCETIGSPGDHKDVIGVGSTTSSDELSSFSSRGPGPEGLLKPDVAAPGSDVLSAWKDHDRQYRSISGTSMACPHVAGVVALMLSAKKDMKYNDVKAALTKGCTTENLQVPRGICGDSSSDDGNYGYPNNEYGHGLVDAVKAIEQSNTGGDCGEGEGECGGRL